MSGPQVAFVTRSEREKLIQRLRDRGATHAVPLYELLGDGVALSIIMQRWAFGKVIRFPEPPRKRTFLALIGDDLVFAEGPAGFHLKSLRKLLGRAKAVWVMAGVAVPEAYKAAAEVAASGGNVVIIETQESEELAWSDFVCRHARKADKHLVSPNAALYRQRRAA